MEKKTVTLQWDAESIPGHIMVAIPNDIVKEMILIIAERMRQIQIEGFSTDNDDKYEEGILSSAGIFYLMESKDLTLNDNGTPYYWPLPNELWKPTPNDRIRELQKGLALGAAELGRLIRLKQEVSSTSIDGEPIAKEEPRFPERKQLDEAGFVFRGTDNKIYLCRMRTDTPWFFYWHPDGAWVSLKAVTQIDVWGAYEQRLSDEEALLYQLKNPGYKSPGTEDNQVKETD